MPQRAFTYKYMPIVTVDFVEDDDGTLRVTQANADWEESAEPLVDSHAHIPPATQDELHAAFDEWLTSTDLMEAFPPLMFRHSRGVGRHLGETTAQRTAQRIVRAVNERWPHQHEFGVLGVLDGLESDDQYCLVEQSTITNEYHITTFPTFAKATDYHETQEHAEDWEPIAIVSLVDGTINQLSRSISVHVEVGEAMEPVT